MGVNGDRLGVSTATLTAVGDPPVLVRDRAVDALLGPRRRAVSERASGAAGVRRSYISAQLSGVAEEDAVEVAVAVASSPGRPTRVRDPEHHCFAGTLSVSIGPFDDLDEIGSFAEALTSIPGVGSAGIRTFDGRQVVFEVDLAEPTTLIAAFRDRSPRALRLLYANERIIRLKLP